ncbi:MAG: SpoIIE family protein phosphatase [Kiritimatiellae bacterium]|nr:SpoIIE family protein phosphatase [Kiritimatiellia bacterium]
MTARRSLNLKLVFSVLAAFLLSLAFSWLLHNNLSERDAHALIDRTFDDVENELTDCIDERLVLVCMAARERLEDENGHSVPVNTESLQALARELRVTEISIVDEKGDIVHSSVEDYLARPGKPAYNFAADGGIATNMMGLIDGRYSEYCQPFRSNPVNGNWRKFIGVWRHDGGFFEIGFDGKALRSLTRSSVVDLFRNWNVGGTGGIVVTTASGLVLSDYDEPNREGTQFQEPDETFYWKRREIESFPVYVIIPKKSAAIQRDVLVGATAMLNGVALVFVALLVAVVISAFVRQQIRAQAEKELKMAKDIQLSALPNVFPPFPDETRFDIWASMETANEVGGDFYDFYFTGQDRVFFLVADVSGKGIPAALFMMRAKTLLKSAAQTGKPIAKAFEEVNNALGEGNSSCTFVTAWAAELNTRTGHVTYVNAGHNPPVLLHDGKAELLKSRPSLALGAMPDVHYRVGDLYLKPGDEIYLYTDGIVEQPDSSGKLYGEDRLLKVLSGPERRQKYLLDAVIADVREYAAGTEQADDCTQLVIRYRGEPDAVSFEYAPTMEDLARASADLAAALESVPAKAKSKLLVAADEIFANIVRYSGATHWSMSVVLTHHPEGVRLILSDDGKPFDPLAHRDPDTTLSAAEREIGGLGILIVKKTMSPVTYRRRNGNNILTMGKDYGN